MLSNLIRVLLLIITIMDREEILDWVIDIMNEEREKNNDIAWEILDKIVNDANINQYEDLDTVVTLFVRVRKWNNITSHWWSYSLTLSKFHDKYDIQLAKHNIDELCTNILQQE